MAARKAATDRARIAQHEREQLAIDLLVERVDLVVAPRDRLGRGSVPRDERVERAAEHLAAERGHPRDVDERLQEGRVAVAEDDLRDPRAVVADPLELADDLQHRDDLAQVAGDRLLRRDEVDRTVLDREPQRVDLAVARDDGLRELAVEVRERAHAPLDGHVDEASEGAQVPLELREPAVEGGARMRRGHQPNLPVM
ncbi:MAG: hypothetical protein HY216_10055 [Candidatus Rokubacteria bacterium]|nr:hypothetical protein [Candidatus Rokubacteria bacterium]